MNRYQVLFSEDQVIFFEAVDLKTALMHAEAFMEENELEGSEIVAITKCSVEHVERALYSADAGPLNRKAG